MASTSRTIRIRFDGDSKGLAAASKLGEKALSGWKNGLAKVDRAFSGTAKTSGDSTTKINSGLVKVDSQIKATRDRLDGLSRAFAETGDLKLFAKMSKDQSLLNQLGKVRAEIVRLTAPEPEEGRKSGLRFGAKIAEGVEAAVAKAGKPIADALGGALGSLPPQAQALIGAGVITAVTAVGPFLGAAISGAVVGGIGIGGVVGGLAIASKHPAVQAAAKTTGETLTQVFQRAAASFVPETVGALAKVRDEVSNMGGEFERIFSKSSRWVRPLTDSVLGFVRNLLPGLEQAIDKADPIIGQLASWGPKLGSLLSDVFSQFSEHAVAGARALAMFWAVFEAGIRIVANTISGLAATFGWFEKLGASLTGQTQNLFAITAAEQANKTATQGFDQSLQGLVGQFGSLNSATTAAVQPLTTLDQKLQEFGADNFSARAATRDFQAAIDAATASLKENGATLNENTPKGRANAEALDRIASTANAASAAVLAQTGSQEKANAVLTSARSKFIALADKMGLSSTEAARLAGMLIKIPSPKPTITVENKQALASIRAVTAAAGKIKDIHRGIYYTAKGDLKVPGGTIVKNAAGGYVSGPGSGTSDSIPSWLSNGEYVIRSAAVRQLGTGFLDQLNAVGGGRSRRTLADTDYLARGPRGGSAPAPAASSSGATGTQMVEIPIYIGSEVQRVVRARIDREAWRSKVGAR